MNESAWSPRIGVSRFISSLDLLIHASYDRVFQTPAMENLLLASSPQLDSAQRPGRPAARAAGARQLLRSRVYRIFRRASYELTATCFAAISTTMPTTTCCSIPESVFRLPLHRRKIHGEEIQIARSALGPFFGICKLLQSDRNRAGAHHRRVISGQRNRRHPDTSKFPVSQDQRNRLRAHVRFQATAAAVARDSAPNIGSGLPADLTGPVTSDDIQFFRGTVWPRHRERGEFCGGAGSPEFLARCRSRCHALPQRSRKTSLFEIEGHNLTNRLNVMNFASLFSGTPLLRQPA